MRERKIVPRPHPPLRLGYIDAGLLKMRAEDTSEQHAADDEEGKKKKSRIRYLLGETIVQRFP